MTTTPPKDETSNNGSRLRTALRWLLGLNLIFAGTSHLTFARKDFRAQVPKTVVELGPFSTDQIVVLSGLAEITLGSALIFLKKYRKAMGRIAAAFFVAVFPGNIAQWMHHRDAFGLDTDGKRFGRLFGQPVLVAWALFATGDKKKK